MELNVHPGFERDSTGPGYRSVVVNVALREEGDASTATFLGDQ
jgi:hypothetical protein